jgi:hypothetical protein
MGVGLALGLSEQGGSPVLQKAEGVHQTNFHIKWD